MIRGNSEAWPPIVEQRPDRHHLRLNLALWDFGIDDSCPVQFCSHCSSSSNLVGKIGSGSGWLSQGNSFLYSHDVPTGCRQGTSLHELWVSHYQGWNRGLFIFKMCFNWESMIAKIVICWLDKIMLQRFQKTKNFDHPWLLAIFIGILILIHMNF